MNAITTIPMSQRRQDRTVMVLAIGLLISVGLHAGGLVWADRQKLKARNVEKPVVLEFIAVEPPKPEPPPEPPKVEPPPPKPKVIPPPPVKLAVVKPPPDEPPPPLEEAKEPPKEPPPLMIGMRMDNTTPSGNFAAPIGNSAMGAAPKVAPNPAEVKPYVAPKYVPPGSADRDPEVDNEFKAPYPDEARRAGIEGTVRLKIVVDFEGRVVEVKVINGPGFGLNEAAREAIKKFRFKPAIKGGEPVSTSMVYAYTFMLD